MGLTWRDPLYMDAGMEKKINRIRWRLEHGAGSFRLYLVTISTSPGMQLDIVSAAELKQPGDPAASSHDRRGGGQLRGRP